MLDELKQFTPTKRIRTNQIVVETVTTEQLKDIFSKPLVLLPVSPESPLYQEGFTDQYELVYVDGDRVVSYVLQTGQERETIDIAPYWREYLATGNITPPKSDGDTNIHMIPLPSYQVAEYQNTYMSCVLLKNNKRAMANHTAICEGCEI